MKGREGVAMRISKKSDYALVLASLLAKKDAKSFLSIEKISGEYNLPLPFLKQIANRLKKAGILESKEGVSGGYRLKNDRKDISVGDVIRAVEGEFNLTNCASETIQGCSRETDCPSKQIWRKIWKDLVDKMNTTTLEQIDS